MGLQKPPEEENLPASTPTRGKGVSQSGDAHGGGVMPGSFSPITSLPPANINDFQPIDSQVSSPKNTDKRLLGRARIRKPSQQGSRTKFSAKEIAGGISNLQSVASGLGTSTFLANDDAAMHRSSESSLSLSQTEQTDEHDPFSANSGRSSALVGQTSSRYSQMNLGTSTFVGSSPASGLGTSTFLANVDAAIRRPIGSSLSFSQTEQTDMLCPSSANSGRSSALVDQTSSRYSQMNLGTSTFVGSSPAYGLGTSTFLANVDAAIRRPIGSSLSFSQTEQTDMLCPSSANSGRSSAFVGPTSSRYSQMYLPQGFQAQRVAGQTPSSTNIAGNMPPGFIYLPMGNRGLLGQITSGQQPFYGNSPRNMPPQSSMYFHSPMTFGGFAAFARGGNAFQGIPFSSSISSGEVTPLAPIGSSYFSQPVIRNQFPVRFGSSQADLLGTQQRGIPQASNIHGQPCESRRGLESRLGGWSSVRPRSKPRPSAPTPRPSSAPTPRPSSAPPVIQQDRDSSTQSLKPSGHQCLICKRDLAFSPDGPLSQPLIPPVVAVLPCHHVFHAQCLENITPNDQSENPPCIPCATGDEET